MPDSREAIVKQIEAELLREMSPQEFSQRLFASDGLFARLAPDREARAALIGTELFVQAQARFSELQARSLERFRAAVTAVERGEEVEIAAR